MSTPSIDPGDLIDPTLLAIKSGVSDNLGVIGGVAGALMAVGIVWRLGKKAIKP